MTVTDTSRPVHVTGPKSLEEMWQDRTLPANSGAAAPREEQTGRPSLPSIREQFPELGLPGSPEQSPSMAGRLQTPSRTALPPAHGNGPEYVHSPRQMPPAPAFTTQPPNSVANYGYGHNQSSRYDAAAVPRRYAAAEEPRHHTDNRSFLTQGHGVAYRPPASADYRFPAPAAYQSSASATYMHHSAHTSTAYPPPQQQQQHYAPYSYQGHQTDRAVFPPTATGPYEPQRQPAGLPPSYPTGGFGQMHAHRYEDCAALSDRSRIDSKVRKRRGNLPKDSTDKLRKWLLAHLHHPYPTEEEKHMLIRLTDMRMNQLSNWFINARRRQLPALLRNLEAEEAAMANGSSRDSILGTPSRRASRASRYFQGHRARRSDTTNSPTTQPSSSEYMSSPEQLPMPLVTLRTGAEQLEQQNIRPHQSEHEEANGRIVLPYRGARHDGGHDSRGTPLQSQEPHNGGGSM